MRDDENKTTQVIVELYDQDAEGNAVWKVTNQREVRYVEGLTTDNVWVAIDRAAHAYDDEIAGERGRE